MEKTSTRVFKEACWRAKVLARQVTASGLDVKTDIADTGGEPLQPIVPKSILRGTSTDVLSLNRSRKTKEVITRQYVFGGHGSYQEVQTEGTPSLH